MAPSRKKGGRAAVAEAAAARQQWKVGDLVLAKMKGFPAWPAMVSKPEKWGFSSDRKKLLVYFYGTKQIAFCNHADIEAFTEEKKKSLLVKRQGKGADFVRAVDEIIDIYEKKQNLSGANSDDDGNNSHNKQLEGSRSKSSRSSPEIRPVVNNNHQPAVVCASAENHDVVNAEEITGTSTEGAPHNASILNNEQTEKVSILDQLRQTPLSTTTTTRKRQRDGSLQSSAMQRVPSLRRSRSSLGSDPCKFQKSPMTGNGADPAGSDLVFNVLEEESALNKMLSGEVSRVALGCNGDLPICAGLLLNGCTDDTVSDKAATRSDAEEGSILESSFKLEKPGNGYIDKDLSLNGVITMNGKFGLPIKAAILKKKRKPNRKRTTNNPEYATMDKETEAQVELCERHPESPNSRKEILETFSKADGDEHLPLVKRARVRMSKSSMEETRLDEFVEKREKLELVASLGESDTCIKSSSPASSPADRRSHRDKEAASSALVNDCALTAGRDPMIWKVNKFQLKGITLDVEAALPPSKRLHRALKAMTANAAEATDASPEGPSDMRINDNGCTDSPKGNPLHQPVYGNVGSPTRLQIIQSSDSAAFHNHASGPSLSPSLGSPNLASQNLEVPVVTPSQMEPESTLTQSLRNPQNKDSEEMLVGTKECNGPCTSKTPDIDIQENIIQPCSVRSVGNQTNTISNEGISDQLSSPLAVENDNGTLQPSKECSYPQAEGARETGSMEPVMAKPVSVMNSNEGNEFFLPNGTAVIHSAADVASTSRNTSGSAKSPSSQSDESIQARDMPDVATPKDWGISGLTPMKDLIAAAQAKRLLSRSTSFPDNVMDGKVFADSVVSPSVINRSNSSVQGSPQNSLVYHRPATDDRTHNIQNDSRSPFGGQQERGFNKLTAPVDANVARRSFEALLCTLSRTKDSIGRATRVAIDCAKYGIAREVIEILLQHLERESSLYKRVDLFFLVDSITQFSRSQKGGVGDAYLSLVQSVLPRLLSAAAPHGNAAWENRRQCLKVLRLWLERKTLPEPIVRHHIREIESVNGTSLTSSYSRRPSRTERSLNDPIREMEGMFVDEYGSNTSFQLQHCIHSHLLEDEEGSGDDEKSFEAVTPEQNVEAEDEKGTAQTPNGKHRHILEDVDGELEMEDVAPPCGVEASSSCRVSGSETVSDGHYQHVQHQYLPCVPPLPEDLPPSPPPLPSSPPPVAQPCPAALSHVPQQQSGRSHVNTDVTNFHLSGAQNNQNQQPQSVSQQPNNFQGNLISSESMHYYGHGYGGFPKQMPPAHCPLGSSGPFASHTATHFQPKISTTLPNKSYPLQPPLPTVSNQFSYIQAEPQQRAQSWGNCSSFGDRFQYVHGPQGGNFYGDRNIREPIQHENTERGRFSPSMNTGPMLSDKAEMFPSSCYGSYSEPASNPSHGWSIPPRISSYSVSASRSSVENPISPATGAPGYWRPR